jgi:hypothetical protein
VPPNPYRQAAKPAIKGLSWAQVEAIVARFSQLNPYDRSIIPGSILKIEDDNFDPKNLQAAPVVVLGDFRQALHRVLARPQRRAKPSSQRCENRGGPRVGAWSRPSLSPRQNLSLTRYNDARVLGEIGRSRRGKLVEFLSFYFELPERPLKSENGLAILGTLNALGINYNAQTGARINERCPMRRYLTQWRPSSRLRGGESARESARRTTSEKGLPQQAKSDHGPNKRRQAFIGASDPL